MVKLVSNWEQNMLYTKNSKFLNRNVLTGMTVSSLAYKCVFYRPEHNAKGERNPKKLNFEGLGM